MANVIIKSDERRAREARTLREFGGDPRNVQHREYAECASAYLLKNKKSLQKLDERYGKK